MYIITHIIIHILAQVDWSSVKKGPRWKANMFRVLVLHQQGGVWVDTDTVIQPQFFLVTLNLAIMIGGASTVKIFQECF